MEQNINSSYNESSSDNSQQHSAQEDIHPALETREEENTETTCFKTISDYWYLPHDGRTFNQNIKIRNR